MHKFCFSFRLWFVLLLSTCFMASCDDTQEGFPASGKAPVSFTSGISGPSTRVIDQNWFTTDRVGICMFPATGSITNIADYDGFKVYNPAEDGTTASLEPEATPHYYPVDNTSMHFVAFAPYPASGFTNTSTSITYTVPSAQNDAANMQAIDFIWSTNTDGHNYSSTPVALTFDHKLSKLQVTVNRGSEITVDNFRNLTLSINNIPSTVTCALGTGVPTAGSGTTAVTFHKSSGGDDTAVYTAIIPPHDNKDHTLTFTITGGPYTYLLTKPVYLSNKAYTYSFTLSKQGVRLTDSDINIWGTGDMVWNGNNYLSTDKLITLSGEGGSHVLSIETDAGAPTVTPSTKEGSVSGTVSWITNLGKAVGSNSKYTVSFDVGTNTTHESREAFFHVTTGANGPTMVVKVIQEPRSANVDPNYPLLDIKDANCIIVPPGGSQATIPVKRIDQFYDLANGISGESPSAKLGASEALYAEVIWSDGSADGTIDGVIHPRSVIQKVGIIGTGPSAYLYVQSGSMPGNAVVAVKRKNSATSYTTLWSWHIWVTGYNPDNQTNWKEYTNNATTPLTTQFMDRNLGALSNQKGTVESLGLLYQWGRKDPQVGKGVVYSSSDNKTCKPYFENATTNGTPVFTRRETEGWRVGTAPVSMATSVQNPHIYYYKSSSPYDWCTTDQSQDEPLADRIALRWRSDTNKAFDDPCPDGWRVPLNGVWNGLTITSSSAYYFPWSGEPYYGCSRDDIGWWPAAGGRNNSDGTLYDVGSYGYYWSASRYLAAASVSYLLGVTSGGVNSSSNGHRFCGRSVRCVRE